MNMKLVTLLCVILALFSSLVAGCAKSEVAEESMGDIIIGILDDLSGPMAGTASAFVDGELDCIKYLNEESSGIKEYTLRPTVIDFKMDGALAIAGWERLRNEGAPIIMSLLGAAAPILDQSAQRDRIPIMTGAGMLDQIFPKEPSYYFAMNPQLIGVYDSLIDLIVQDWAKQGKSDTPRVGFDFISLGTTPRVMASGAKYKMEQKGWENILTYTSIAPADVTTQVLQMKDFGCEYIYLFGTEAATIVWLKELDRQDFHPKIYSGVSLGSQEVWSAAHELAVGCTFYQCNVQWTDSDIHGVSLARQLNSKWHPDVPWRPGHYFRGFAGALAVAEALRTAIEHVGYENLTGEAMKASLEEMNDFDPMEMGIGYTWTPTDHQGLHGVRWYIWTQDGIMAPTSDWYIFEPLPDEQRSDSWWIQRE
jgi:hypothetical protein